jgi:hypothetical protein
VLIAIAFISTALLAVEAKKKQQEPAPSWKVEFSEYLRGMKSYRSGEFVLAMEIWLVLADKRYEPARLNGESVEIYFWMSVAFNLH